MGKIDIYPLPHPSGFRKVAMGTWRTAKDPSVYGILEIDMKPVLDRLPQYCERHGVKVTPSHLVGRAAALCMKNRPEINGMIRWNKIYLRRHVDIFYQVNIPGQGEDKVKKANLAGAVVRDCANLTVAEIAKHLSEKAGKIRNGEDQELAKNMSAMRWIPWWLAGLYLDIGGFLLYTLNLDLSLLGLPRDPFGSLMITNVGSLGIDLAFAPLCPYTRVPLLITVGSIKDKPWVVDGRLEVRPILQLTVTFDHRFIDGIHASQMAAEFKRYFADPDMLLQ